MLNGDGSSNKEMEAVGAEEEEQGQSIGDGWMNLSLVPLVGKEEGGGREETNWPISYNDDE